jgi:hypothetical protein
MKPVAILTCLACALLYVAPVSARLDTAAPTSGEASPVTAADGDAPESAAGLAVENVDLGHTSSNPYQSMVEDLVSTPKTGQRGLDAKTPDPKAQVQRSLFYDENELKSRLDSVKSAVSSLLGDDEPKNRSDEERELGLQRDIAMRDAYRGAHLAGGSSLGDGGASAASTRQDDTAKVRLIELAFLLWDILTHPVTLTILVLYGLARLTLAIVRVAKDPHGRRKRGRRSAGRISVTAPKAQPVHATTATDVETEQERRYRERRRRSRRHRSRRSFLDYFRST